MKNVEEKSEKKEHRKNASSKWFETEFKTRTDLELIEEATEQILELARTGGKSHTMSIPPQANDTDLVLFIAIQKYKRLLQEKEENEITERSRFFDLLKFVMSPPYSDVALKNIVDQFIEKTKKEKQRKDGN